MNEVSCVTGCPYFNQNSPDFNISTAGGKSGACWCRNCIVHIYNSAIMKKSTSRPKPASPSTTGGEQKNARPERHNRARPARDNKPENSRPPGNSTIHNGSAGAFDATEEVRD
jgi:hypothetical protein